MRLSRPLQNKAPPHIEGELLKQKDRAVIGRKKWWKKYLLVMSEYCVCELLVVCYYNVQPAVCTDTEKLSLPHSMDGAAAGFDDGLYHKVLEVSKTDTV